MTMTIDEFDQRIESDSECDIWEAAASMPWMFEDGKPKDEQSQYDEWREDDLQSRIKETNGSY